jgi:hypothetical protein
MKARIISQTDIPNQRLCRLRLPSGETLFIKLILAPGFFLGIWELGSMNPITIAIDWLLSLVTGHRTAGMIQIWGLGDESGSNREAWRLIIRAMFGHEGDDRGILDTVAEGIMYSPSIAEFRRRLALIEAKIS